MRSIWGLHRQEFSFGKKLKTARLLVGDGHRKETPNEVGVNLLKLKKIAENSAK